MREKFDIGLAATKLRPPTLPGNLVRRSRLDDLLDTGLDDHTHLLLISAPAGSGKSTLLASWLSGRPGTFAWLQAETSDDDPARFWTYLVEAISEAQPSVRAVVQPVVSDSTGDHDSVISALITALAELPDPLVIVIDDYHLITSDAVHRGAERLIELCPPHVTIVVSTRFDPPFRLGRLRVRGHLIEVRGDGLRFDVKEATNLLATGDRTLSKDDLELLSGRTEGWAAGLVLAGLSLRQSENATDFIQDFHGDDQLVVDYLSDEFLAGVTDDHRSRLLATSILEQFSGALVDAITDSVGGKKWLSETAASNQLVIGLDRTGEWFRFHHLFRDLLRSEAQQSIPDQLPEFHRRAASWFEGQDDRHRAVAHWLAAGEREEAAQVMFVYGPQLIAGNQIGTLRRILGELGDVVETNSVCALLSGWCEYIAGRYSEAEKWVAVTHKVAPEGFDQAITSPLRMNIFLGRGDVHSALAIASEVMESGLFDSLPIDLANIAVVAGGTFMWAGQEAEATTALRIGVDKTEGTDNKSVHVLALIYQAIVAFEAGSAPAAGAAAQRAIATADELGIGSYHRLGPAYAIRARTDEVVDAADLTKAIELARKTAGDLAAAYVLTICGDVMADRGNQEGQELFAEARRVVERCPDPGIVGRHLDRIESRHAIAAPLPDVPTIVDQLTERETAVLRYLPTTLSQREIAGELFVSTNTVKTHCAAIYRKLAVSSRKAAVQAARDLGLI